MWNNQSAITRAGLESSNREHDGAHRRADPVVLVSPILSQGVNAAAAGGGKFRVEPWTLGVVIGSEAINCVWAPFGVNNLEHRRINGPVVLVNKSAEKICFFMKRPWDPLPF